MKKLLIILSSFSIFPSPILVVSCKPIESFPSTSFKMKSNDLKIFFSSKSNEIKLYNFEYLKLINNSWEHVGFLSNLSTHKADKTKINTDILSTEEKKFIDTLVNLYKPIAISTTEFDFTGLTFAIENIFLNSIKIDSSFDSNIQSEVAITIKKGWKTMGKILFSLQTAEDDLIPKIETFGFINKLIESFHYDWKIVLSNDSQYDFLIEGDIDEDIFERFKLQLIEKQTILAGLSLTEEEITYDEEEIVQEDSKTIIEKTMEISGMKYKFI